MSGHRLSRNTGTSLSHICHAVTLAVTLAVTFTVTMAAAVAASPAILIEAQVKEEINDPILFDVNIIFIFVSIFSSKGTKSVDHYWQLLSYMQSDYVSTPNAGSCTG